MTEPLSTWNDGEAKNSVMRFVEQTCGEATAEAVPVEERVAVFDNDGTLWCEKPMPVQMDFIVRRLVEMAHQDDRLRGRQPWKAAFEKDYGWLGTALDEHYAGDDAKAMMLAAGVLAAYGGISVEEFEAKLDAFLRSAQHPTLGRGYLQTSYAPMVQLLAYLETNGFSNYVVSGGGRDFIRPVTRTSTASHANGSSAAPRHSSTSVASTAAPSTTKPRPTTSMTGPRSRCASGAERGAAPYWRPATPTATSRCWNSPSARTSLPCACLCCTTPQTVSSTMSPARNRPWNELQKATGPW